MTTTIRHRAKRHGLLAGSALAAFSVVATAQAQDAPIVQPGAPGTEARDLSAEEATRIADISYSPDDVRYLQDMIPHHAQALEMTALIEDRTNNEDIVAIGERIDAAQEDEIAFMRGWLRQRGEDVPEMGMDHDTHMTHRAMGMATADQMAALASAEGLAFDQLFLELMIRHHEGAVRMTRVLLDRSGSAFDPALFEFTADVISTQNAEIDRMAKVLAALSPDPRVGLSPGLDDAGSAIENLSLLASLPRPAGFFDPENPTELMPAGEAEAGEEAAPGDRYAFLSFSNTDMAFYGSRLVAGNYHGFNVYDLDEEGIPELLTSVVCPGGQGDVSVVGDLLIMSVQETRSRIDCGLGGVSEDVSPDRFRGLRIFDISDPRRPSQVGLVQTCRGSHTHSVAKLPAADGKIIVYNSGISRPRPGEELEGCSSALPGDQNTSLFRIDVIEIPVDNPSAARIVDSPAVFQDATTGDLAGLWRGGDHGENTQDTYRTDHCHDITVFPEAQLAAGACAGNGILFDISDPLKPRRLDAVTDEGFAYWHSATFNNDGTKVLFTDEWGGGVRPRCRASDPKTWGADAIYDIDGQDLVFKGYYKIPAPQSDTENCVAHNGSIIPVPGRDIYAQAWYQGGLSVMDFTDSANATEIAYFDRGPIDGERVATGGYWSVYWYNGRIYGTEIIRGLDVLALEPSDFLSENEIQAASLANMGDLFNPQQQFTVTWPAEPVVARAYLDGFARDGSLRDETVESIGSVIDRAETVLSDDERDRRLSRDLRALAKELSAMQGNRPLQRRRAGLAETLEGLAERVR